jgi:superfamily I DNA and/or RNA helicase
MEDKDGHEIRAKAIGTRGKQTKITVDKQFSLTGRTIKSIRVVGREDSTLSDSERNIFILRVLQGEYRMEDSTFINKIWFSHNKIQPRVSKDVISSFEFSELNASQRHVAHAMIDVHANPILLCHGPPGTGKTRTIAAVVKQLDRVGQPSWLCAQSNVGVKNIAETLFKNNIDFRIIVSKEFYVEW